MNNCQHFWSSNAGRQECLFCRVTRQAPVEAPAPAQLTQDDEKHKWNEQGDKPWTCVRCGLFTANLRHIEYGFCRHKWTHRLQLQGQKLTCCGRCGVVKNERNPEKPCIGKVFIETRAPRPAQPAPPAEPSGEVPEWMKAAARECMAKFIAWPPVVNTAVDIFYKHYASDAAAPAPAEPSVAEVLPCPFCGSLSHLHEHDRIFNGGDVGYRVECEGTCHSMTCYWHTREQALEVWNRRAAAPSPAISEPPTTMSEFQAATNADAILRSLDGYKSCPKCGTEWLAGEGVGCPTCQPAISEEDVARKYVHLAFNPPVTHGSVIDWEKVILAAIREVSRPLRERVKELEGHCDNFSAAIMKYENDEAGVCPEDVGFVEYIGILQKRLEDTRLIAKSALASSAPPHSDGIGGVCLGCEDCNPGAPNSRRRPLAFESKEEAQEYSKQAGIKIWAKIWSWTGVFEIYPGGRSVWNKNW